MSCCPSFWLSFLLWSMKCSNSHRLFWRLRQSILLSALSMDSSSGVGPLSGTATIQKINFCEYLSNPSQHLIHRRFLAALINFSFLHTHRECSRLMVSFHQKAGTGKLTAVYRKYNTSKFGYTSKSEPAVFLLEAQK